MTMKTIKKTIFVIPVILLSCIGIKTVSLEPNPCSTLMFSDEPEYVFYNWYKTDLNVCKVNKFKINNLQGYRKGSFVNGRQSGKWITERYYYYDSLSDIKTKYYLGREEYFKDGLRDSIYKIYNKDGKVIYSTYFKDGNGIEKDFHENGTLYYEIETKRGYFTDTLRLYNKEGKNFEKRLYQKDVLVYYIGNDWCLRYRYKPNDSSYLEVDSYELKNLKQGAFRNTFSYKTKEEFENDHFAKNTLKR